MIRFAPYAVVPHCVPRCCQWSLSEPKWFLVSAAGRKSGRRTHEASDRGTTSLRPVLDATNQPAMVRKAPALRNAVFGQWLIASAFILMQILCRPPNASRLIACVNEKTARRRRVLRDLFGFRLGGANSTEPVTACSFRTLRVNEVTRIASYRSSP